MLMSLRRLTVSSLAPPYSCFLPTGSWLSGRNVTRPFQAVGGLGTGWKACVTLRSAQTEHYRPRPPRSGLRPAGGRLAQFFFDDLFGGVSFAFQVESSAALPRRHLSSRLDQPPESRPNGRLEIMDPADHLGSTQRREFGLTVGVHAALVLGSVLLSQPQLSKSSPHEQPIGISQLGMKAAPLPYFTTSESKYRNYG